MSGKKARALFLCTHNSARSQMAEGLLRHLAGDRFEAFSAGTEATAVRPLAARAMAEVGVDISGQESETLDRYLPEPFDYVVTVCDDAKEACPFFPGAGERLHWSLPDPSKAGGTQEERLAAYRGVRDEIRERIEDELLPRADTDNDPSANRAVGPPVACDLMAMDAIQRERYGELRRMLGEVFLEVRDLPDGYAFGHSSEPSVVLAVAEYVTLERLCCPFLDFRIELGRGGGPLWLPMTGGEGTKEVLGAALGAVPGPGA